MNKRTKTIYDDDDVDEEMNDDGEMSSPKDEMASSSFKGFLKELGLSARDEKRAMRHLSSYIKSSGKMSGSGEDEDEWEEFEGTPLGYDKKMVKQKDKVRKYENSAYDDDDEDYLKDRLQQNQQYYK